MKSVDLSTFDNAWYKPASGLKQALWYACSFLFVNTFVPFPSGWKRGLLILFGAKIGNNFVIKPSVNIKYPWLFEARDNVWLGENSWIDNLALVSLGNNVCISQGAYILTGNHDYKSPSFDLITKPVTIHDGVWVGAKATVCPGVTLASHSILTVGSIATKDLEPYTIYSGNPAMPVRKRLIEG